MKVFYQSGIVNECLILAEVKPCEWREGFANWVYENYSQCYEVVKELGSVKITELPGKYEFINVNDRIGSLPGVHPVFQANEEKIKIFLETIEHIKQEKIEAVRIADERIKKWKKEKEERLKLFTIIKVYHKQMPTGGELDGQDGYYDADLKHITGEVRMVARNVFDFGFYCYPKRVEGTDDVFNRGKWTELEKQAEKWLGEFSPFTTLIRM